MEGEGSLARRRTTFRSSYSGAGIEFWESCCYCCRRESFAGRAADKHLTRVAHRAGNKCQESFAGQAASICLTSSTMAGALKTLKSTGPAKRKRKTSEDVEATETGRKPGAIGWKKPKATDVTKLASSKVVKPKSVKFGKTVSGKIVKPESGKLGKITSEKGVKTTSGQMIKTKSDQKVEKPLDRKARKELAEFRKKKRKPNYDLEKEVKTLWEKMRRRNLPKEEREKLVSETLSKMKGKLVEMGRSHIASRVLQSGVKYCRQSERDAAFEELRPHTLALSANTYAYHLVIKMLDHAKKPQLQQMLSILHGHVVSLLRHPVGSAVVEHAYQLANGPQKRELVCEFYAAEYRLFKGLATKSGLSELMATEPVSKQNAILEYMTSRLQPILEKGIVDHSIVHRALVEYLSVCSKAMAEDVVKSLAGPLLIRMIHTKDGAKVGAICIKLSTAKERKNVIRGMKGHVSKIAQDEHSSIVLLAILDTVDDTKIISKIIISELIKELSDLASHKYGRRWLLHLLAPRVPRYFPPDVLAILQHSPAANLKEMDAGTSAALGSMDKSTPPVKTVAVQKPLDGAKNEVKGEEAHAEADSDDDAVKEVRGISKKDPAVRRLELLSAGGLGKKLAEVCFEHVDELLGSPVGVDLIYEVAMGGSDGLLWQVAPSEILLLHKAIADIAAGPSVTVDTSGRQKEHVLEQYFSSRMICRLIQNSESPRGVEAPSFAVTLWTTAFKGKGKLWAKGHSAKVISTYQKCVDATAKEGAQEEIQELIDAGLLKKCSGVRLLECNQS